MLQFIRHNTDALHFLFASMKNHKRIIYIFIIWEIIWGMFLVLFPILAKWETDQLVEQNSHISEFVFSSPYVAFLCIIFLSFTLKLLERAISFFIDFIKHRYIKIFEIEYENTLFHRLTQVSLGLFLNSRNKRVINDCLFWWYDISNYIRWVIWPSISNTISLVWIVFVLSYYQYSLLIVIIISSFLVFLLEKYKEIYHLKNSVSENYELEHRLSRIKFEMAENPHQVAINGGGKLMKDQYVDYGKRQLENIQKLQKVDMTLDMLSFVTENLWNILIKAIVWYLVLQGTQSLWFMTMTLLYLTQLESIIRFFQDIKFQKNRFEDAIQKLSLFLWLTKISLPEEAKESFQRGEAICTKNLSFSYPNISKLELEYFDIIEKRIRFYQKSRELEEREQDELHAIRQAREESKRPSPLILQDISCCFTPGNIYGIVGKNGAGKTTFTHVLLWFFSEYTGSLFSWKTDYSRLNPEQFYNSFSVVSQEPYILIDFSIRENLLLWVTKQYSDEAIYTYLKKFNLDTKIQKLRLWLDSRIGYDSNFSGWEKQLLVLIRNILQDRPVLIMDEWTNQLDAENELLVMQELLKNKKDKIIIFITHRMTTMRKADTILCLEGGKISAQWTHAELLKYENVYTNFWKKQVEQ